MSTQTVPGENPFGACETRLFHIRLCCCDASRVAVVTFFFLQDYNQNYAHATAVNTTTTSCRYSHSECRLDHLVRDKLRRLEMFDGHNKPARSNVYVYPQPEIKQTRWPGVSLCLGDCCDGIGLVGELTPISSGCWKKHLATEDSI